MKFAIPSNTSVNIYMANKQQTATPETHVNSVTG